MCPSVELSTASLVPTVTTHTTDIQVHMVVHISDLKDISPPVNHLSLASSIHSETIIVLSVPLIKCHIPEDMNFQIKLNTTQLFGNAEGSAYLHDQSEVR